MDFGDDLEVVAVRSSEGEVIGLTQIISTAKARGQVEKWLVQLEASVKCSIKKVGHVRSIKLSIRINEMSMTFPFGCIITQTWNLG